MKDIMFVMIVIAYVLTGVFTYGHALNDTCVDSVRKNDCVVFAGLFFAPLAAVVSPLYWSYQLQKDDK